MNGQEQSYCMKFVISWLQNMVNYEHEHIGTLFKGIRDNGKVRNMRALMRTCGGQWENGIVAERYITSSCLHHGVCHIGCPGKWWLQLFRKTEKAMEKIRIESSKTGLFIFFKHFTTSKRLLHCFQWLHVNKSLVLLNLPSWIYHDMDDWEYPNKIWRTEL